MKKNFLLILICLIGTLREADCQAPTPKPEGASGQISTPWETLDYPASKVLKGVEFDMKSRRTEAPGSDIWPITWADDDHQYSAFGDGGGFGGSNKDGRVSLGIARIEGGYDDYQGKNVWGGLDAENEAQFSGKGTGILSIDGVLYMWVAGPGSHTVPKTTLAVSHDHARTWQLADWQWTMRDRLFAGVFINAGRDYSDAPDNYVYACFTRVEPPPVESRNWFYEIPGRIDLARAPKDRLLEESSWEWFLGLDAAGNPKWSPDKTLRSPAFEDPNGIKVVSLCYQPVLKRYLLVYCPKNSLGNFSLFEGSNPWGPWHQVAYMQGFPLFMPPKEEDRWRVSIYHFAPKWWSRDGREFTLVFNTGDDAWNTVRGKFK